ncbi:MAG: hypothetical protein ACKVOT_11600 [Polaromonas sp.]
MKNSLLLSVPVFLMLAGSSAHAQQIYRCISNGGVSEYINNAKDAQARGCKPMTGGNVTVVQGTAVSGSPPPLPRTPARNASGASSGQSRFEGGSDQRARDSDSRVILEAELKKAETRLAELQKEYNNGEPEKQGIESRNYQRYLDRVAEMRDGLSRLQSDIAGIKREISRLPSSN